MEESHHTMQADVELKTAHEHLERRANDLTVELARLTKRLESEVSSRIKLQESIRCRSEVLEMTFDAIVTCNLEGQILTWNQGAVKLYGWPAESAKGRFLGDLVFPNETTRFATNLASIIAKREYVAEETHSANLDRSVIVQTRWSLIRNSEGKEEILTVSNDVTEQKELERQFFRMQRLETVGLLASGIAHDLNNVLAPILMASQNLLHEVKDEGQADLLRSVEASARRGGTLVHQILSFARGTEGERAPLQIKQLMHEFQKVAKDTFPRSIQIVTQFGKNIGIVLGNKTQLYQSIMNLCVNARDAMPDGGILQIEANNVMLDSPFVSRFPPAPPGEYVLLRISDNGIGISENVIGKIFDPFFTTKETGKGTGLGLSTMLGIVKRHGGFLEVSSRLGKGTKFSIYLPAIESTSTFGSTVPPPVLPSGNGKLVLIVDDERVMRDITASTLKKHGYQILTASDGTEGFALFTQHKHDISVVVTDLSMPYMDGTKMIRALHQIDPRVKVIAASGMNEEFKLPEALKRKIPFLKKPFAIEKLLEMLHEVLGPHSAKESSSRQSKR